MQIMLYPHGGSGNHGCEALIRSTSSLFPDFVIRLISKNPEEDYKYGINKICRIISETSPINRWSLKYLKALIRYHILNDSDAFSEIEYSNIISRCNLPDYALSIGGDNYCYSAPTYIYIINRLLRKRGVRTILWGCSVEPNLLSTEMLMDLMGYSKIIARESFTQQLLISAGLPHVELIPDPAFLLEASYLPLPHSFINGNTVGINISPMIISKETYNGITINNYVSLVRYILDNTNMSIAFIPHVVWADNDDREAIAEILKAIENVGYNNLSRICVIGDHTAEELKGYISRCRFMVVARTHASIAAYSSMIPTLVVGYSVKAKGIAYDIFGSYENFVLPVQSLKTEQDLSIAFGKLMAMEDKVKKHLKSFMPSYICKTKALSRIIE